MMRKGLGLNKLSQWRRLKMQFGVVKILKFLFLICSEGVSSLMKLGVQGLLKGAKVSKRGSQISHLLFANDCILFGEATLTGAQVLKQILLEYEDYSG